MSTELRAETLNCPQCGASGEALLGNGLCARCLLGAALDIGDIDAADAPREVGRYRIDGEIAHGGVGIVYRAWQADLQRTVALKMLLPARLDAKDARDRFRREAEAMASLDHPGILPVYEVGVDDGVPFFSMKLAEGGNLAERIPALRGRSRECAHLVAGIARAIAHAHARGVLHRDLKPSNIVFDAIGQPLITDFGLALFLAQDSSVTGVDAVIGTPRYVAPEVVASGGARLTAAADVYGLGAILYELLCGRAPFAELAPLQVLQQIGTRPPRPLRQIDATIPATLEAICFRCLEKRPADRYASANALAGALERWLAEARPNAFAQLRAWAFDVPSRRRRAAIGAALVLAFAGIAAWYASREPMPIPNPSPATLFDPTHPLPSIAFASRDWIVVGDLKNLTGDKVFDDSLQAAFRVGLEQSRYVNVVPDLQVRGTLKRMERDATTSVDRAVGSEIALREGARVLVIPTIAEVGGRVRLTAEIVDPSTRTSVYSDSVDGAGEESVLPTMDTLLKKIRERLGESLGSIGETSAPLEQVTTKNLDALKAYSLGSRSMADGNGGEAVSLFNQAVALDPTFAEAYLYLANIYYTTGQRAKAYTFVSQATQHLDRLSAREKLSAEGYAAFFRKSADMREKWSVYARLYPDGMSGQQNLAVVLWWFDNALKDSAEQFRIVADSRHPRRGYAWMSLGDVELGLGDTDAARKSYAKAREVGAPQLYLDPLNLPIAERDYKAADEALAHEDTHKFPAFEVEKEMRTASLELSRGRLNSARAATARAADLAAKSGLETSRQRARLADVAIALALDEHDARTQLTHFIDNEIKRAAGAAAAFDYSSYANLALAAQLALRHGEQTAATRALATLKPLVEKLDYFNLDQAYRTADCESRVAADAPAAVSCLEALLSERSYYQTRVALLRAYLAAGNNEHALMTARWLAEQRGRAVAEWVDQFAAQVPNLIASDEALIAAAELSAKIGQPAEARRFLQEFAAAWPSPEGEPPLLRRARALEKTSADLREEN